MRAADGVKAAGAGSALPKTKEHVPRAVPLAARGACPRNLQRYEARRLLWSIAATPSISTGLEMKPVIPASMH